MQTYHEDRKDVAGNWIKTYQKDGRQVVSRSAQAWYDMRKRTNTGGQSQQRRPRYEGCLMSVGFEDFQSFATWNSQQVGYGIPGYQLDKDILVNDNKIYGEDTCVLVPSQLNAFFTDRRAGRGNYPQGVCLEKTTGFYTAQMTEGGKMVYLGFYRTVEAAAIAYKEGKEAAAYRWYTRLASGGVIVDERVIQRMKNYKFVEGLTNGG